jgi:hypothetical protein
MKVLEKIYKVIHIYMVHHYITSNYGWNVCKMEESVFEVHNYKFYSNILSTYLLKSKLKEKNCFKNKKTSAMSYHSWF